MKDSVLNHKQRNASLDLLRILSMLMIVILHCLGHGGVLGRTELYSFNYFSGWTLEALCYVAVNCYVLISGYFLCEGSFKLKKLFTLYGSTWFWSVALYVVFLVVGTANLSIKTVIKACFPFTQQTYWFVTTYLLMYILSPFLNIAIRAMSKRQHAAVIAVFFGVYIVLQNIIIWRDFTLVGQNDPMFFMFLYFVAAYIRRYPPEKKKIWLPLYLICAVLTAASRFILTYVTTLIFGKPVYETMFFSYNSILTVVGSVSLFIFFCSIEIKGNKVARVIIAVAPLTFGVYLIHEEWFMRNFLWQTLIRPDRWANSPWMLPLVLAIAVAVFVVCCCLEKARQLFRRIVHMDSAVAWFSEKVEQIFGRICNVKLIKSFWE